MAKKPKLRGAAQDLMVMHIKLSGCLYLFINSSNFAFSLVVTLQLRPFLIHPVVVKISWATTRATAMPTNYFISVFGMLHVEVNSL
jgi:hypothetical protein